MMISDYVLGLTLAEGMYITLGCLRPCNFTHLSYSMKFSDSKNNHFRISLEFTDTGLILSKNLLCNPGYID